MKSSLLTLTGRSPQGMGASASLIPRPTSRWKLRLLVPAAIVALALGLLAYSARAMLVPAADVWVVPVVPASVTQTAPNDSGGVDGELRRNEAPTTVVQAPGWIEPAPYSTLVPALADGVVREILVLEGDRVEAGQVVARLDDREARLVVESAEAQLAALRAGISKAEAEVRAAEAKLAEIDDQVARSRKLAVSGGATESQLAQLQFRLTAVMEELVSARAAVLVTRETARAHEVACEEARLRLARMEISSPISGVVLARFVEPGSRISMSGRGSVPTSTESMNGAILRLYDPGSLQVRVDIPLADFAKVHVGAEAEITTEALPDRVFRGSVSRIVHEANIQRNTVQVKVGIEDPVDTLKPEMLVRVRFPIRSASSKPAHERHGAAGSADRPTLSNSFDTIASLGLLLLIPERIIQDRQGETGRVWVVEHDARRQSSMAASRAIRWETSSRPGFAAVTEGLRPGDRVIVDAPSSMRQGQRVRIKGEAPDKANGVSEVPR